MDTLSKQLTADTSLFTNADLRRLIVPLIIEQFLICMVGMADTMMVSALGEASVSGVSLMDLMNIFLFQVFAAMSTGGAVVVSQMLGAKDMQGAHDSAKQLMIVSLAVSLIVTLLCELFCTQIIRVAYGDLEEPVMNACVSYFRWTSLSFPFFGIYNGCAALLRSMNRTKLTMYSSLTSNIVNVSGNALLIYGFKMGVSGAAISTVASRFVMMLMMLIMLMNRNNLVYISFRERWALNWGCIKRILSIGIPSGIENGIFQLGRVVVVGVIATFGTMQVTANAVANNMDYMGVLIGGAFSLAIITVIGQSVGTGNEMTVRFYVRKMMKIAWGVHVLWNLLVFALLPLALSCYVLSDDTYRLAWILILIHNGIGIFLWPWSFAFPNVLRAANDVRSTMIVSITSMILLRVGMSHVLGKWMGWGAIGVWIAMVMDWMARVVMFLLRYHSNKWVELAHLRKDSGAAA